MQTKKDNKNIKASSVVTSTSGHELDWHPFLRLQLRVREAHRVDKHHGGSCSIPQKHCSYLLKYLYCHSRCQLFTSSKIFHFLVPQMTQFCSLSDQVLALSGQPAGCWDWTVSPTLVTGEKVNWDFSWNFPILGGFWWIFHKLYTQSPISASGFRDWILTGR